jgi:hypothetical protein
VQSSRPCPVNPQEIAEAYMLHRLPEDQVETFEEHYFVCANCATRLHRVAAYVDDLRAAARKLWSDGLR